MEDNQIVGLFWQRDEKALAEVEAKYGAYCRRLAQRVLNNERDAEECVADAYLDVWNRIPPHKPSALGAFIGKIVRHIAIDKLRKRSAQKRGGGEVFLALEELEDCISSGDDVEKEFQRSELAGAVNDFLSSLPETERRVFLRRYWYMDSIDRICERFGFSESKVKTMLHRTREKLREYLAEQNLGGFTHETK